MKHTIVLVSSHPLMPMYQTNPPSPPSETMPTMHDLPSEELADPNLPEEFHPKSPLETMPTMYDLPSELVGESGLPDEFHRIQADALTQTCQPPNHPPDEVFIASDLNLYYDPRHPQWYKRPDWFLVLGVSRFTQQQDLRLSYLVWQEGIAPFMVVELLSPTTEQEDLGQTLREVNKPPTKWQVYEQILRIPYYVIFDRYTNRLRVFRLEATRYQELSLSDGRLWLAEVQLGLGVWQGSFEGTTGLWLRWYDANGEWFPTYQEQAAKERLCADEERLRANEERLRAQRAELKAAQLAERLRSLGIDPDSFDN